MFDSCNISPYLESQISDDYCSLDEPTYANETQWFLFNSNYADSRQNSRSTTISHTESNPETSSDEKSINDIYCQINKDSTLRQSNKIEQSAAVVIQRFYRNYRKIKYKNNHNHLSRELFKSKYRKLNESIDKDIYDEINFNSAELENEGDEEPIKFSDNQVDQGFESCSNDDLIQLEFIDHRDDYANEHIYDSIPCDLPSPPLQPNHESKSQSEQHHIDCPLSKARKYSEDFNRIHYIPANASQQVHPQLQQIQQQQTQQRQQHQPSYLYDNRAIQHRKSESSHSPHSVFICQDDLINKVNSNLYVVRHSPISNNNSQHQIPVIMAVNRTCPQHHRIIPNKISPHASIQSCNSSSNSSSSLSNIANSNNNNNNPQHFSNSSHSQVHVNNLQHHHVQQHQQHQQQKQQLVLTERLIYAPSSSANNHHRNNNNNQLSRNIHQHNPHNATQLSSEAKYIQAKKTVLAKRMYRVGLNVFNENPASGISYLIKHQYINSHPSYIAKFLLTKSGISRCAVGEYLGLINDSLANQVTKYLLRRINMKNKEIDEALRSFIYYVHLPGEAQKISHLMEEFQEAYLSQNEPFCAFKNPDTIMVLSYAIIMLQTDAHNNSIKKCEKMTEEQFIHNLRGVDDNSDIDPVMLENMYHRIVQKEMRTMIDHTDQVRRLNEVIVGPNKLPNFVTRSRRFMCYCRLNEIPDDKKFKVDAHQREVFLFNDILVISKLQAKSKKDETTYLCKHAFVLSEINVKQFITSYTQFGIQIVKRDTNENLIKFSARCVQDQKKFCFDLADCIYESLEMLKLSSSSSSATTTTTSSVVSSCSSISVANSNNTSSTCDCPSANTGQMFHPRHQCNQQRPSSTSNKSSPKIMSQRISSGPSLSQQQQLHQHYSNQQQVSPTQHEMIMNNQNKSHRINTTPNPPRRQESLFNTKSEPVCVNLAGHPSDNSRYRLNYHNSYGSQI